MSPERSAVLPVYARSDIQPVRGEGCYLYDAQGRKWLDFASGIAVTGLGHCHPHLVAALTEQAKTLWHVANLHVIPEQERLASRLCDLTFADYAFFTNSGVEAWECALKMVRRYHNAAGNPGRWRMICFQDSFHGRTLAAISAGGQEKLTKGFAPLMDGFDHIPFADADALEAAIGPETAAICFEPVTGESGLRAVPAAFMQKARALADRHGLLLVLDEVQCGMGRTGTLFAHEGAGITPDIMCVAKALGGGFPVGACLANEKSAAAMDEGSHGSTYGGNPLAMAVANAVLDVIMADGFLSHVRQMGQLLHQRLHQLVESHPHLFCEVRGQGLMAGLRCTAAATNGQVLAALRAQGLLAVRAGENVIRLLPPLIIDSHHVEEAHAILDQVARAMARRASA